MEPSARRGCECRAKLSTYACRAPSGCCAQVPAIPRSYCSGRSSESDPATGVPIPATSQESVHQLQDLIQKIALNNKIEESQELARNIQTVLYKRMSKASRGIHNRGVRKAPFVVLIGANMPSILTEISFLSNAHSERLLKSSAYREQIAK